MPSVGELTASYENFLLGPRRGPDVCGTCLNLIDGYAICYACVHGAEWLDAIAPISYSVAGEPLHSALWSYKRLGGQRARRLRAALAAVLSRYLACHEPCIAVSARTASFDLITTVPSGDRARDERHPLRWIVGELAEVTRDRHERLLRRSEVDVPGRRFHEGKFVAVRRLRGQSVLLVDDTWTTGANAQSAAAALKAAGAGPTAAVVIGRHLNREWRQNDRRLRRLARPFDWSRCVVCADGSGD